MKYLSVNEIAKKWNLSERTVRNYCANGKIKDAFMTGKTWNIPENAQRPIKQTTSNQKPTNLLEILRYEKNTNLSGSIYHKIQIDLTYNSNHIEGSKLTHDQTRYIFETNTIGFNKENINVDDIIETMNHFRCVDLIIELAHKKISESFIKELHLTLKNGTSDSRKSWFAVGDYKKYPNEVGGKETTDPKDVKSQIRELIHSYNSKENISFEDILEFHYQFECIHPFQDGNGRVGRLLMFKECLRFNIVPFILDDSLKLFYYRGLKEWKYDRSYLLDTCLHAQDNFKKTLDYFKISYEKV